MIEIVIVGVIVLFILFYSGRISSEKFVNDNKDLFYLLKESDYEFLLLAKYGDKVYDVNQVFMRRIRNGFIAIVLTLFIFISEIIRLITKIKIIAKEKFFINLSTLLSNFLLLFSI